MEPLCIIHGSGSEGALPCLHWNRILRMYPSHLYPGWTQFVTGLVGQGGPSCSGCWPTFTFKNKPLSLVSGTENMKPHNSFIFFLAWTHICCYFFCIEKKKIPSIFWPACIQWRRAWELVCLVSRIWIDFTRGINAEWVWHRWLRGPAGVCTNSQLAKCGEEAPINE